MAGAYPDNRHELLYSRNISYWKGGGANYGVLNHCTVVDNTGTNGVGGAYNSTVVNSIVHGNTPDNYFNAGYGSLQYSCTAPLPGGWATSR